MKAIILNHPRDIEIFKINYKNFNFYAYNFYTYSILIKKYKNIKYVNDYNFLSKFDEFAQNLSIEWFQENRKRNLKQKKISIGNIIMPRLINEFPNKIKNYLLLKKILSNNSKIYFPYNQKIYINDLAKLFPKKYCFIKVKINRKIFITKSIKCKNN